VRSMRGSLAVCALVVLLLSYSDADSSTKKHHKHHKKHHNDKKAVDTPAKVVEPKTPVVAATQKAEPASEKQIVDKMKSLEGELAKKEEAVKGVVQMDGLR